MSSLRLLLLILIVPLIGCSASGTLQLGNGDDDDATGDDDDATGDDDDATGDDDDDDATGDDDDDDDTPNPELFAGEWGGSFALIGGPNADFPFCEGEGWLEVDEGGEYSGFGWCQAFQGGEFWTELYGMIDGSGELWGEAWLFRGDKEQQPGPDKVRGEGIPKRGIDLGWDGIIIRGNGQELPYVAQMQLEEADWDDDDN